MLTYERGMNLPRIFTFMVLMLLWNELVISGFLVTPVYGVTSPDEVSGEIPIIIHVKFYDYNENTLDLSLLESKLPSNYTIESQLPLDSQVFPIKFNYLDTMITGRILVSWQLEYATPLEINQFYEFLQSNASLGLRTGVYRPFNKSVTIVQGQVFDALEVSSYFSMYSSNPESNVYNIFVLNLSRFDTVSGYHWFQGNLLNNDTSVDMRLGWSAGDHGLFFDPTAFEWFSSFSKDPFIRLQDYLIGVDTQDTVIMNEVLASYFSSVLSVLVKNSILQLPMYRLPPNYRKFWYAHTHYSEESISYIDFSMGGLIYKFPSYMHELMPYTVHDGKMYRSFINQGLLTQILFNDIQANKNASSKEIVLTSNSLNRLRNDLIVMMQMNQVVQQPLITVFDFVLDENWRLFVKNATGDLISPRSPIPLTGIIDLTSFAMKNKNLPLSERITQVQRCLQEYGSIFGLNLINRYHGWAGYIKDPMSTYDQDGTEESLKYSRFNMEVIARYQALYWNITTRANLYVLQQEMKKITNWIFGYDFSRVRTLLEKADSLVRQGNIVESVVYYWDAWDTLVNQTKAFVDEKVFVVNSISLSLIALSIILLVIILRDISLSETWAVRLFKKIVESWKK